MTDLLFLVPIVTLVFAYTWYALTRRDRYHLLIDRIERTATVAGLNIEDPKWPSDPYLRALSLLRIMRKKTRAAQKDQDRDIVEFILEKTSKTPMNPEELRFVLSILERSGFQLAITTGVEPKGKVKNDDDEH